MTSSDHYHQQDAIKALGLGKATEYRSHYAPELLQAVPRQLNRDELNIQAGQALPFLGFDLWNMYELSWLNAKGKPEVALGVMRLDASSPNLIESKSFKLYLNSFNQTKFDDWQQVRETLERDLSACAKGQVSIELQKVDQALAIEKLAGDCLDELDIEVGHYQLQPEQLKCDGQNEVEESLYSNLLKSNCLVTNQPDWGSVYIDYQGPKIDREALLRYIISFREHNEFHEQCVERIYCDIMRFCQPSKLSVYARYTRRGGLDINPVRTNDAINLQHITNQRLSRQ